MKLGLATLVAILSVSGVQASAGGSEIRVIDGDTLELSGIKYRLHGIDAPETSQVCRTANGGTWQCGKAAVEALETLAAGGQMTCDSRGVDKYGRTIGVCTVNGKDINAEMVNRGLAWSFKRYSHDYDTLEESARAKHIGIWQADTQTAWDYRSHKWQVAEQSAPNRCSIKGNISTKGQKIYHMPWSKGYAKTRIDEARGEQWFCSEADAIAAGWRAPYGGN